MFSEQNDSNDPWGKAGKMNKVRKNISPASSFAKYPLILKVTDHLNK